MFSSSRTRAVTAAIAAVATVGLMTTACSSDNNGDARKGLADHGPITFAMGKTDTDKLKPVIEKWNKAHPEEKVELKELAGEADAQRETLVQSVQSGSGEYDVMALDVTDTAAFAANQWIQPLTSEMAVDTSKLLKPTVESAAYKGTLYAMPQNTNGQLLYRNTELAPEAPKNFGDLKKSCEKAKAQQKECLTTQLKQYEGLTVNAAGFIEGWGGHILADDAKTPTVDTPETKAGLKTMVDAYKDGTISKNSISASEEETYLAFTRGESAFAVNWPYMFAKGQDAGSQVKDKFEVQPIVGKDGVGVSTLGGYNNAINIHSEHKATAKDFISFIVNEDNQRSFAEASFPPVLASIYDDQEVIQKQPYMPALKTSLEHAKPRPVSPFYPAISKAVQDNAYAALSSGKSIDDATKDMKAAIETAGK